MFPDRPSVRVLEHVVRERKSKADNGLSGSVSSSFSYLKHPASGTV